MKNFQFLFTRFLVICGCFILVACGGDQKDVTCKDCSPIASFRANERHKVNNKVELDGRASKPGQNGGELSYNWTLLNAPEGSEVRIHQADKPVAYLTPDRPGVYRIQLIVNDGVADSKPCIDDFEAIINSPPVAHASYNDPVRINESVLLDATLSEDKDNDPLTYVWELTHRPNMSHAELSDSSALKPEFVADIVGEYIVQLIVNDGELNSEPFTLTIRIYDKPVAIATFEQHVPVHQHVQLDGTSSQPGIEGNDLTFQWTFTQKPPESNAQISDPSSERPTFMADKPGLYIIQLIVNDGIDSNPFILEYTTLNSKPIAQCEYNQPVYLNQVVELNASLSSDLDNDPLTYEWELTRRPNGSAAELSDPNAVTSVFIPDRLGDYIVQLIVNDGKVNSDPIILTIQVYEKPVAIAVYAQQLPVQQEVQLDGTGSRPGTDGNSLTFQWDINQKPDGSNAALSDPTSDKPSFIPDKPGIYIIQLIVNDGINDSAPFILEYETLNSKPIAQFDYNKPIYLNQVVELAATPSSDLDNDPMTCLWEILSRPENSNAVLSDPNAVTPSFVADQLGDFEVQLIVNDGHINSEPYISTIQVLEIPVAVASYVYQLPVQQEVQLDATNSQPGAGGGDLSFQWTIVQKPDGSATELSDPTSDRPTFVPDKPGLYIFNLIVNDGINESAPFVLEYETLNSRPIAQFDYNHPIYLNQIVALNAMSSSDLDNEPLTYTWEIISHPEFSNAVLSNPNAVTPSFVADQLGDFVVQLIVNDGHIDSEPHITTIQVLAIPVAVVSDVQQLPVQQEVQLDASGSRPGDGGGDLTFQWTIVQKPDGSATELSDPTSDHPTFVPDKPGLYIIHLIVNDGINSSDPYVIEYETQNSKPVAHFGFNQPIYVNQLVELDGSQSFDLDNDPLMFKWKLLSKPMNSMASLSGANGAKPSFVADRPGKYVVQLVVNDGKEDSDTYTQVITTQNSKPVAIAGEDVTVFEGEPVQMDGSLSTDADGSSLVYMWTMTEKPNGSHANLSGANRINPVFTPDVPGLYTIQLIVNDGEIDSDPDTLDIYANASVDLEPANIDLSDLVTDPDTLLITGTVHVDIINTGTRPVPGSFQIFVFEDTNNSNQFENSDLLIAVETVENQPDGRDSITVDLQAGYIDGQEFPGDTHVSFLDSIIFVAIDPLEKIPEIDETNNLTNSQEGQLCKPPVNVFSPTLAWEWTKSLNNDFPLSNQVVCTPIVGNLTDDNKDGKIDLNDIPDIVFITFEGSNETRGVIRAISGDGSSEHFAIGSFVSNDKHFEAFPNYNPALADIDNDGIVEIMVVVNDQLANKWLAVFEHTGELKWISHDYSSSQMASPASVCVADLKADGIPEIIIGHFVLSNTGQTLMIGKEDNGLNNASVADIDLDSQMEIIAGRTAYEADGKILWHVNELNEGFNAIANFDNDDYPEIVLVGKGRVALVEHTGEIIWTKEIAPGDPNRYQGGPPMISDVDGDGQLEIGIAGSSKFWMFNGNGSVSWTADIKDPSAVTSASAFDFDGDGCSEIVYRDSESLKIFNGHNGERIYEDSVGSSTFIEMPVIADVDNDNSAEIVVPCNSYQSGNATGIRVYEDASDHWVNTRKIWNQHAYMTTNILEDGRVPKKPINNWETYNNFRQNQMDNPFGCKDISASYIRFDLDACPDSVKITARIGNSGALHVPIDMMVSFYLGNPAGTGQLLAEIALEHPIQSGQWIDLSVKMEHPGTGIKNIFVFADSSNRLWESNENNNISQRSFTCDSQ
jgi:hypothetical protein